MSTDRHKQTALHINIAGKSADSTVKVILFCGGLLWAMRCGFTIFNQEENQQACNEDISFHSY
jgi:hypothetical protein